MQKEWEEGGMVEDEVGILSGKKERGLQKERK